MGEEQRRGRDSGLGLGFVLESGLGLGLGLVLGLGLGLGLVLGLGTLPRAG